AAAANALEGINEARRLMENNQTNRLSRDVNAAADRAEQLAEQQRQNMADLERIRQQTGAGRQQAEQQLMDRKTQQAAAVRSLTSEVERLAAEAPKDQRATARQLSQAADSM